MHNDHPEHHEHHPAPSVPRRFFSALGPGIITGAADDDPSGIATYSIAGAQLGTSLLWMAWITWPLMGAVQMMCARIGMMSDMGLSGAFKQKFPKPLLIIVAFALLIANTINIGADLSGMADAAEILTGIDSHFYVVVFGLAISFATIRLRYHQIAGVLKWLALALLAYVINAFLIVDDWSSVLKTSFTFSLPEGKDGWAMLVAILGTTISPYLFFWQASQEVEEGKAKSRRMMVRKHHHSSKAVIDRIIDVTTGTFFSNIVMFFIILTSALTLHANGITDINSSKEAAEALSPLAGKGATLLYAIGLIGVGLLAIPTLSGSAAYAFAETFEWAQGLDAKFKSALAFYAITLFSTIAAITIDFLDINPIRALFLSAVVNGLLAPFLMVGILIVARDNAIMKGSPSSKLNQIVVAIATLVMFLAAIGMFVF